MPLYPKTPPSLASFKSRLVLPFWYRLTQAVLEKRPLNGCSAVVVVVMVVIFVYICNGDWCLRFTHQELCFAMHKRKPKGWYSTVIKCTGISGHFDFELVNSELKSGHCAWSLVVKFVNTQSWKVTLIVCTACGKISASHKHLLYAGTRAAAIARANEAKKKKSPSPQQSMLSSIGKDLDRCVESLSPVFSYLSCLLFLQWFLCSFGE